MEMCELKNNDSDPNPPEKKPEEPKNMAVDTIEKIIGSFGLYQWGLCFLIFMTKLPIAFHQMAIFFLAPKITFTCEGVAGKCPCENPVYDTSVFSRTIGMEFDLICGRAWLGSFNQTMTQLGILLGSVFFGMASDRFGRKWPLMAAIVLQVSAGILAAFMPNYWLFTFVRFLVGLSVGGTMVVGFVIIMEFVGAKYRDVTAALYQAPFNVGAMVMTACGYFFRDYSDFQLSISIPTILMLTYFCLVPESPRWLIAMKKTDQAVKILERVAKINKRPTDYVRYDVQSYQSAAAGHHLKKGNIIDLFRTPNLRRNICVMAFNWLSCSFGFYGLAQFTSQLSGDIFINVAISSTVTLFGTLLSVPLIRLLGRKYILIIFNLTCTVCLVILIFVPPGMVSVILASIGVVSAFIVFVLVYLYASELFPTVVRNAALGFCSMMARVGSMIAPFVLDMSVFGVWIPPVAFAVVPFIASLMALFLPETRGCELMNTLEEGENFGTRNAVAPKKGYICSIL